MGVNNFNKLLTIVNRGWSDRGYALLDSLIGHDLNSVTIRVYTSDANIDEFLKTPGMHTHDGNRYYILCLGPHIYTNELVELSHFVEIISNTNNIIYYRCSINTLPALVDWEESNIGFITPERVVTDRLLFDLKSPSSYWGEIPLESILLLYLKMEYRPILDAVSKKITLE